DGIRDRNVTGVQTCALPIFQRGVGREELADGGLAADGGDEGQMVRRGGRAQVLLRDLAHVPAQLRQRRGQSRRRTGENGRSTVEIGRASCREREYDGVRGE